MELFWYVVTFCFGAIIGSFLNVVIYRIHTGRSLNGRSHCLTCGKHLEWYELFPIVSYIIQGAKCRGCTAYIPSRYLGVELLTALSFLLLYGLFSSSPFLFVVYAILLSILIVLLVYDMRHTVIPDELTMSVGIMALVILVVRYSDIHNAWVLLQDVIGGGAAAAFFGSLWYVSKGRWIGFGDAKLALPLGVIAGIASVFTMVVLAFWIGAAVSLVFLGLQKILKRGKTTLLFLSHPLTMRSEVPFAPFLILGFIATHFFHADIFVITATLLPW